jgi:hypothetical protein
MKPKATHDEVEAQITQWLDYNQYYWYPVPNKGAGVQQANIKKDHCQKGANDLVVIIKGLHIGIEVKTEGDTQSKAQKEFQAKVEKAGGIYLLAYSIDDIQILDKIKEGTVIICTEGTIK